MSNRNSVIFARWLHQMTKAAEGAMLPPSLPNWSGLGSQAGFNTVGANSGTAGPLPSPPLVEPAIRQPAKTRRKPTPSNAAMWREDPLAHQDYTGVASLPGLDWDPAEVARLAAGGRGAPPAGSMSPTRNIIQRSRPMAYSRLPGLIGNPQLGLASKKPAKPRAPRVPSRYLTPQAPQNGPTPDRTSTRVNYENIPWATVNPQMQGGYPGMDPSVLEDIPAMGLQPQQMQSRYPGMDPSVLEDIPAMGLQPQQMQSRYPGMDPSVLEDIPAMGFQPQSVYTPQMRQQMQSRYNAERQKAMNLANYVGHRMSSQYGPR